MRTTSRTAVPDSGRADVSRSTDAGRIADELAEIGISTCPEFLPHSHVRELARECSELWRVGACSAARVGSGSERRTRRDVRGDDVFWLRDGATPTQLALLARMELLRAEINRRTYLGLFDYECHFAVYAPGAAYERHLDRFRGSKQRLVSTVIYLNESWKEEHGGALRIYASGDGDCACEPNLLQPNIGASRSVLASSAPHFDVPPLGGGHFDVPPLGGTLVTFLSGEFEHEVLPATRTRMSVAGWFRARG